MTTKEKYELFDKTKINEKVLGILKNMQESSKNFTDESVNSKIDSALDKLIENFRANKPEALLTLPEAKKEVKKEKEKAIKKNEGKDFSDKKDTDDKTGLPKKDTLEERKDIIKEESETEKEARDRAKKELEKEKEKAKDEVESQIEKLNRIIMEDPALRGFNQGSSALGGKGLGGKSNPLIDAERKALPRGSRVSQKGWKNQYGASDGGRKYYENRENRTDRKSPDYETGKPYLAKGGNVYSSDELYIVKVYDGKTNELLDMSKRVWARNLQKAKEEAIDNYEYDMKQQYGDDLRFRVEEAPSMFADGGFMANGGEVPKGGYKAYANWDTKNNLGVFDNHQSARDFAIANMGKYDTIVFEDSEGDTFMTTKDSDEKYIDYLFFKLYPDGKKMADGGMMAHGGKIAKDYAKDKIYFMYEKFKLGMGDVFATILPENPNGGKIKYGLHIRSVIDNPSKSQKYNTTIFELDSPYYPAPNGGIRDAIGTPYSDDKFKAISMGNHLLVVDLPSKGRRGLSDLIYDILYKQNNYDINNVNKEDKNILPNGYPNFFLNDLFVFKGNMFDLMRFMDKIESEFKYKGNKLYKDKTPYKITIIWNIPEIKNYDNKITTPATYIPIVEIENELEGNSKKYADGGEVEGVDLFEDYDDQPEEVQAILANYEMEDNDYETLQNLKAELESIGYTMEFGLDAEPYDLRKIGEKGKSEFYAKGGFMADGGVINTRQINKKVKDWYIKTYPTDDLGKEIDDRITFRSVWGLLGQRYDVYKVLKVADSVIRERVFEKLSEIYAVDYDVVYNMWLRSDKYDKGGQMADGGKMDEYGGYKVTFQDNTEDKLTWSEYVYANSEPQAVLRAIESLSRKYPTYHDFSKMEVIEIEEGEKYAKGGETEDYYENLAVYVRGRGEIYRGTSMKKALAVANDYKRKNSKAKIVVVDDKIGDEYDLDGNLTGIRQKWYFEYAKGGMMADGGKLDEEISKIKSLGGHWQSYDNGRMAGKKDDGYVTIENEADLNDYIYDKTGYIVKNIEVIEKEKNYPYNRSNPYFYDTYLVTLKNGSNFTFERSYGRPNWQGNVNYIERIKITNINTKQTKGDFMTDGGETDGGETEDERLSMGESVYFEVFNDDGKDGIIVFRNDGSKIIEALISGDIRRFTPKRYMSYLTKKDLQRYLNRDFNYVEEVDEEYVQNILLQEEKNKPSDIMVVKYPYPEVANTPDTLTIIKDGERVFDYEPITEDFTVVSRGLTYPDQIELRDFLEDSKSVSPTQYTPELINIIEVIQANEDINEIVNELKSKGLIKNYIDLEKGREMADGGEVEPKIYEINDGYHIYYFYGDNKAQVLKYFKMVYHTNKYEQNISIRIMTGSRLKHLEESEEYDYIEDARVVDNINEGDEMAHGGGIPYKPYGKTKGRFKLTYEVEGEEQSEIRESLEEATDSARRYVNPKLGYTNVHIYDESGKEYFFADGGMTFDGIGFIPMDLEEKLMITAKWGGTNIKGVIGILNAMIDSNITDEDLRPKPTKTGSAFENAVAKKTKEIWAKIEPQYKGDFRGNMYYSTIRRLVERSTTSDEILKRYKPFRKYQKNSFASNSKITEGGYMADGGYTESGEKLYEIANNMSDKEFQEAYRNLSEKEKDLYESLLRLGDEEKIALVTVLNESKKPKYNKVTWDLHRYAKGGMMADGGGFGSWESLTIEKMQKDFPFKLNQLNRLLKDACGDRDDAVITNFELSWMSNKYDTFANLVYEAGIYLKSTGSDNVSPSGTYHSQKGLSIIFYLRQTFESNGSVSSISIDASKTVAGGMEKYKSVDVENYSDIYKYISAILRDNPKNNLGNSSYAKGGEMAKGGITPQLNDKVHAKAQEILKAEGITENISQKQFNQAYDKAIKEFGYSPAYFKKVMREFGPEYPDDDDSEFGDFMADGGETSERYFLSEEDDDGYFYIMDSQTMKKVPNTTFDRNDMRGWGKIKNKFVKIRQKYGSQLTTRDAKHIILILNQEDNKLAQGGETDGKYTEYEMVVLSKNADGKSYKYRFLISARNIDEAKQIATDGWHSEFGDMGETFDKVMTDSKYRMDYGMADGGEVDFSERMAKMRSAYENLNMIVKSRIAVAIGIDRAISIMENDYSIDPFGLITSAVRSGLLELDEINKDLVNEAVYEAERVTDDYRDSGQGIGGSDMTYFTKNVLDSAGYTTGFVNNRLTRVDADGNELVIDKYEMNY